MKTIFTMGNLPWVVCLEMMTRRTPPSDSESVSSSINDTVVLTEPTPPVSKNHTNNNSTPLVPYTDSENTTVSLPTTKGKKE